MSYNIKTNSNFYTLKQGEEVFIQSHKKEYLPQYNFYSSLLCQSNAINLINKFSSVPNSTKLRVEDNGVKFSNSNTVIPRIVDVKSYNNKVVIVKFSDNTIEKAVLSDNDIFSLEQGISICLTKKILSYTFIGGKGSSAYNKLIDYAIGVYKSNTEKAVQDKLESEKAEDLKRKKAEKSRAKQAKRKAREREEQIEIQAEAYRRAMSQNKSKG